MNVNDRIEVVDEKSKHYGKTGTIVKVGRWRLTIDFDHGKGKYVEKRAVRIINQTEDESDDDVELPKVLQNLAITGGTMLGKLPAEHGKTKAQTLRSAIKRYNKVVKMAMNEYVNSQE